MIQLLSTPGMMLWRNTKYIYTSADLQDPPRDWLTSRQKYHSIKARGEDVESVLKGTKGRSNEMRVIPPQLADLMLIY